jgi:hypothetical protein
VKKLSEADFLVKLRDGATMIADACQERLEKLAPAGVKGWDAEKIKWVQAQGSSGPYEKSDDVDSLDFKLMLKDLQEHNGKLSCNGYFYWVFTNGSTVGRKLKKSK